MWTKFHGLTLNIKNIKKIPIFTYFWLSNNNLKKWKQKIKILIPQVGENTVHNQAKHQKDEIKTEAYSIWKKSSTDNNDGRWTARYQISSADAM